MTDTQTREQAADPTAAERLITIRRMQSGIDDAAKVVADCKEALHDAKETWNVHVMELGDFIRDGSLPLFDRPEDRNTGIPETEQDEAWRTIHLSELTDPIIKPAVLAKLANAGIETIGEMADKKTSDLPALTDIPGIGAKAAGDIDDALAAFWTRWTDQQNAEAYQASIQEIPASAIKLPKDKSFFDYYCGLVLGEETGIPAKVDAFEHDGFLYTIASANGGEDAQKTAEAWALIPKGNYGPPSRNAGPHPTDPWMGYEGRVVVFNDKKMVMTGEVRIVLEDSSQ